MLRVISDVIQHFVNEHNSKCHKVTFSHIIFISRLSCSEVWVSAVNVVPWLPCVLHICEICELFVCYVRSDVWHFDLKPYRGSLVVA